MGNDQSAPQERPPVRGRGPLPSRGRRGRGRGRGAVQRALPKKQEEEIIHYKAPTPPPVQERDTTFRIDPYRAPARSMRGEEMRFAGPPGAVNNRAVQQIARPDPSYRISMEVEPSRSARGGFSDVVPQSVARRQEEQKEEPERYSEYLELRCGNPYRVLGVPEGSDFKVVRKAAQKLAKKHHPDKGGDPKKWEEIEEAYVYLREMHEKSPEYKMSRKVGKQTYDIGELDGMTHKGLGEGKFNLDRFNEVFEKNRVDDPLQYGYGGGDPRRALEDNPRNRLAQLKSAPEAMEGAEFDDDTCYDLIEYREPMALPTGGGIGFAELDGFGTETDFTNQGIFGSAGFGGTDYKRAFHKRSHIDTLPEGAEVEGRPKTLHQYQQERDSISFQMSAEEAQRRREMERAEELREEERQRRFQERRRLEDEHYARTHVKMIRQ